MKYAIQERLATLGAKMKAQSAGIVHEVEQHLEQLSLDEIAERVQTKVDHVSHQIHDRLRSAVDHFGGMEQTVRNIKNSLHLPDQHAEHRPRISPQQALLLAMASTSVALTACGGTETPNQNQPPVSVTIFPQPTTSYSAVNNTIHATSFVAASLLDTQSIASRALSANSEPLEPVALQRWAQRASELETQLKNQGTPSEQLENQVVQQLIAEIQESISFNGGNFQTKEEAFAFAEAVRTEAKLRLPPTLLQPGVGNFDVQDQWMRQWSSTLSWIERRTGLDAGVVMGIIASESGWGAGENATVNNNYFGIKLSDNEWQQFNSPADSLARFMAIVSNPENKEYTNAWANRNNPTAFIQGLIDAHYLYEDPNGQNQWTTNLMSIAGHYRTLNPVP